jgi:ribosome recycling factor
MTEESQFILDETTETMENTMKHMDLEFQKIRAGKASPAMLQGVKVEYYGTVVPIEQTSNIGTPDPRQIIVQPFDKNSISAIEKAILNANLGFNPKNEGDFLRILVPPLTEERRKELAKRAKTVAEETKVGIRNIRRNSNDDAKKLKDEGVSEDEVKLITDKIQEITDKYVKKVDELCDLKVKDILTV